MHRSKHSIFISSFDHVSGNGKQAGREGKAQRFRGDAAKPADIKKTAPPSSANDSTTGPKRQYGSDL
jgi:hypothetical protein